MIILEAEVIDDTDDTAVKQNILYVDDFIANDIIENEEQLTIYRTIKLADTSNQEKFREICNPQILDFLISDFNNDGFDELLVLYSNLEHLYFVAAGCLYVQRNNN